MKQSPNGQVPQAQDMERAVIGAMLLDKEAVAAAIETIPSKEVFYNPANAAIFQALVNLFEASKVADILTLTEELRRTGELEKCGGEIYLVSLTDQVSGSGSLNLHAHIVLEKYLLRELVKSSQDITQRALADNEDTLELLEEAEQNIFRIAEHRTRKTAVRFSSAAHGVMDELEKLQGTGSGVTGIASGLTDLDALTCGFQKQDLIIVGGRPSHGKTALVLDIALHSGKEAKPAGIFSMEMSTRQLVMRLVCAEGRVSSQRLRTGRLSNEEWKTLTQATAKIYGAPIFIDDTPSMSPLELRAKARRMKAEHKIELIIVDYLQMMHSQAESREREISNISRSLKALAKELDVPVIACAALNRLGEGRKDKLPSLGDLRDSGMIESDADVVIFVHRPELHGITEEDGKSTRGLAKLIVAKQRNGPTDTVETTFINTYSHFVDKAREYQESERSEPVGSPPN